MGTRCSGATIEFKVHVYSLHALAVVDRLNSPQLTAAEHVARRCLQIMKAMRKNARSPDYEGLEPYLRHMRGPASTHRTPQFAKYVTEEQNTDAFILKQSRLAREEADAEAKRKKTEKSDPKPKGKGKGKDKEGDG